MYKKAKKKKNKPNNKKITPLAQHSTDVDMLNKINHISTQYHGYESSLYQFYNRNRFSINTAEDKQQFLLTYKDLEKTYKVLSELIMQIEETSSSYNALVFLIIKYNALFTLYYRFFNPQVVILYSSEAIKILESHIDQLHFKEDWAFQEVIFSILMSLNAHYVNNEYPLDHHLLLAKFSAKCDNNIYKLMSAHKFYFPSHAIKESMIDTASIENLHDFTSIYEKTVNELETRRVNNTLDLNGLLDYLQANLIMLNFNMTTHRSSVWHWDKLKDEFCIADSEMIKIPSLEFKHYVDKAKDWSEKYIKPTGDLFLEINWDVLKFNAKCLIRIKDLVKNWMECLFSNMRFLLIWNETHESSLENQALKHQILNETIELQTSYLKINKSLNAYFVCYPKNPIGLDNQVYESIYEKLTDLIESQKNQFISFKNEQIELQIASQNNALELIQKVDIENAIKARKKEEHYQNKIIKKTQNMRWIEEDKTQHEQSCELSSEEEFDEVEECYFSKADQFISQFQYDKAMVIYRLALEKAENNTDDYKQLSALDGLMVCHSRFFKLKLNAVHSMLANHINNANLPLNNDIILAIQEMILDYNDLLDINKKFDELVCRPASLVNPKIAQSVQLIKDNMLDFLNESQPSINKAKSTCDMLFEKSKNAREDFIFKLGMEKAQELNVKLTDTEVYQLGKTIFIQIGEGKAKSYAELSQFTLDRGLYKQLLNCFDTLSYVTQAIRSKDVNSQTRIGFFNSPPSHSSPKIANDNYLLQLAMLYHVTYCRIENEIYFHKAIDYYNEVEKIFSDTNQDMNQFEVLSYVANIRNTHFLKHPQDQCLLHEAMRAYEEAIHFYEHNRLISTESKGLDEHIQRLKAERDILYENYGCIGRVVPK